MGRVRSQAPSSEHRRSIMRSSPLSTKVVTTALLAIGVAVTAAFAQGPNARPQTWVDCELFDGVVTPTSFDPSAGPFDQLYAGGNGFKDGVPLISEAKPGDPDYNGGRWHMNVLKSGVNP